MKRLKFAKDLNIRNHFSWTPEKKKPMRDSQLSVRDKSKLFKALNKRINGGFSLKFDDQKTSGEF